MKFATSTFTQFWVCVKQEHPDLGQKALEQLLSFASTYLCEASFSAMTDQNKAEKQIVPGEELDHSSCLPATKTDKDSQWSTSFSLKCNCKSTQFNATMFNLQCWQFNKSDNDGIALCITYFFQSKMLCAGKGVLGWKNISQGVHHWKKVENHCSSGLEIIRD